MNDKNIFSEKKSKKGIKIAAVGGSIVVLAGIYALASSCENEKKKIQLDEEKSITGTVTLTTTSAKEFVTTADTKFSETIGINSVKTSEDTTKKTDISEDEMVITTESITTGETIITVSSEEDNPQISSDEDTTQIVGDTQTSSDTTKTPVSSEDTTHKTGEVTEVSVSSEEKTGEVTEVSASSEEKTGKTDKTGEVTEVSASSEDTTKTPVSSSTTTTTTSILDVVEPAISKVTAEDIVQMSIDLVDDLNNIIIFKNDNYNFSKLEAKDLYSVVYLANMDYVSREELQKLIDKGIVSDNISLNVSNSFYFFELYANDTINKIMNGDNNIVDLSIFMKDERGIKTAKVMNEIIKGFITNSKKQNRKNYLDTIFFYVENTTMSIDDYDFSKSVYPDDRDAISIGANYVLSYGASCIDELAKMAGVSTEELSKMMYDVRVDFSDIVSVFNNCCGDESKKLVKN